MRDQDVGARGRSCRKERIGDKRDKEKMAPPTTSASSASREGARKRASRTRVPKLMAKFVTGNRDPILDKGIKRNGRRKC